MQAILLYNIVTVTKQQRVTKMEQWQIELIKQWAKSAQDRADPETTIGAYNLGRADAFQAVLDLIAAHQVAS